MISLRQFAEHMERSAGMVEAEIEQVVVVVTERARMRARAMMGTYQPAMGPFAAMEPLSTATLEGFDHPYLRRDPSGEPNIPGKIALGYAPPDNPLVRSGDTRDSIEGEADGNTGMIGSDSKIMLWQEMGTPNALYPIPARPVLGRAVMESVPDIEELMGEVGVKLLVPEGER